MFDRDNYQTGYKRGQLKENGCHLMYFSFSSHTVIVELATRIPLSNHAESWVGWHVWNAYTNLIKRSTLFSSILATGGGGPRQGAAIIHRRRKAKKNFMKCILTGLLTGLAATWSELSKGKFSWLWVVVNANELDNYAWTFICLNKTEIWFK